MSEAPIRPPRGARAEPPRAPEEPPPVLGAWWRVYTLVLGVLAVLVLLFHLFARRFA
jgi:hypothetical protein